jgi:DoxX-like protein
MDAATQVATPSKAQKWTGYVLSTLVVLFLLVDSVMKLLKLPVVLDASAKLGFSASVIFTIGVILLLCVILYVIPQTSVLGAILLTGYLGGAVCTHLRLGIPCLAISSFRLIWALYSGLDSISANRACEPCFPSAAKRSGRPRNSFRPLSISPGHLRRLNEGRNKSGSSRHTARNSNKIKEIPHAFHDDRQGHP